MWTAEAPPTCPTTISSLDGTTLYGSSLLKIYRAPGDRRVFAQIRYPSHRRTKMRVGGRWSAFTTDADVCAVALISETYGFGGRLAIISILRFYWHGFDNDAPFSDAQVIRDIQQIAA